MLQQIYGANLSKTLAVMATALFLTGCSLSPKKPEPEIVTVTRVEKVQVPLATRPKPINLVDTRIYVVNEENLEQFIEEFTSVNGDLAYIALSVKDYENLALNIAELRRFINQQNQIIIYYEESLSEDLEKPE